LQPNWLSGATGFNAATAPALNHRSELLADNIDSAKLGWRYKIFYLASGQWAQKPLRPNDEPLQEHTPASLIVAAAAARAGLPPKY